MITRTHDGDVALLTIDRHERRNALDVEHCQVLHRELTAAHDGGARAVVLTGAGSTFCAGADLGGVYGDAFRGALDGLLRALVAIPVPVIAAVGGPAIGAGTQLAIACDLRVLAPTARFAVPTARNGLAASPWTVRRLGLVAGVSVARALLVGVDTVGVERALNCGLGDRTGDLPAAMQWARELATFAPLSLAYSKLALTRLFEPAEIPAELDAAFDACWDSDDIREGQTARDEKRTPRFVGR